MEKLKKEQDASILEIIEPIPSTGILVLRMLTRFKLCLWVRLLNCTFLLYSFQTLFRMAKKERLDSEKN